MSLDISRLSQMQQYYLTKQLPAFSTQKQEIVQKKDSQFYSDQNIWNIPSRLDSKVNATFQHQQEKSKMTCATLNMRMQEDQLKQEEKNKSIIRMMKVIEQERLEERRKERLTLQVESMQNIVTRNTRDLDELEDDTKMFGKNGKDNRLCRVQKQQVLSGRAPHSWNKLNDSSSKYIEQAINPRIIAKDEEAVAAIQKKILKEQQVEEMRKTSFLKAREETRNLFINQHNKNRELETKSGLIPEMKHIVIIQTNLTKGEVAKKVKPKDGVLQKYKESLTSGVDEDEIFIKYNDINNKSHTQNLQFINFGDHPSQKQRTKTPDSISNNKLSIQKQRNRINEQIFNDEDSLQRQNERARSNSREKNKQVSYKMNTLEDRISSSRQQSQQSHTKTKENLKTISTFSSQDTYNQNYHLEDQKARETIPNFIQRPMTGKKQSQQFYSSSQASIKVNEILNPSIEIQYTIHQKPPTLPKDLHLDANSNKSARNSVIQKEQFKDGEKSKKMIERKLSYDRDFLTSADSHQKRQVNFNSSLQSQAAALSKQSETKFEFKNLEGSIQHSNTTKNHVYARLSIPKAKDILPRDYLDRSEFKGLLTSEVNCVDSNFTNVMMKTSPLASIHIANQIRPSTRNSNFSKITQTSQNTLSFARPSTSGNNTRSTIFKTIQDQVQNQQPSHNNESEMTGTYHSKKNSQLINQQALKDSDMKQQLMNELDGFDEKFQASKDQRKGFSQSNLSKFREKETFMSAKSALEYI